ncbi:hypothetical protein PVL29_009487 [Vitis rotundifolia]|uniref:Cytokinin riboside 5'-monophosphate phosphoribohydrolase n=1 Tax=Vitis rotundifolia TaxID=103349 RepID=A0AA38ZQU9_VITRO|nr:hypothetical protein PVL29_009487 [Vitis rotundifolia]
MCSMKITTRVTRLMFVKLAMGLASGCRILEVEGVKVIANVLQESAPSLEVLEIANMHQRKAEMARHSDCFIALPSGFGTLEELLEVITWAQRGIHDKPVGLLNVDDYYNYLITYIDKAVDDGFIKPSQRHIIVSAPNAKELVQKLEEHVPLHDGVIAKARWMVEQQQPTAYGNLVSIGDLNPRYQ